ncbi:hypothetical protein JCM19238_5275 [Vibrio ponticus]|nr:hypothetical protein JCM19238_5275 [Vibrio ponticus]
MLSSLVPKQQSHFDSARFDGLTVALAKRKAQGLSFAMAVAHFGRQKRFKAPIRLMMK